MARAASKAKPVPDKVEFFDFEQRSEDWFAAHIGVPTASRFSTIMASGQDGEDSVARTKLMHRMAGEILTGQPAETFRNEAMERGIEMEPEARAYYERVTFSDLKSVGFVKRTIHQPLGEPLVVGCSPDSIVDDVRVLEIKTLRPDLMIPIIKKGAAGLPARHRAQCQGAMWVIGLQECDLQLFYKGMPVNPRFRLERDDVYIAKIKDAVDVFSYELRKLVADIRAMAPR